jgi:hypothetical protein
MPARYLTKSVPRVVEDKLHFDSHKMGVEVEMNSTFTIAHRRDILTRAVLHLSLLAFFTCGCFGESATKGRTSPQGGALKAADYGAICDGKNDDTDAINKAVHAAVAIAGGAAILNPPSVAVTVELPQGLCSVHAPIVLNGFGSIAGSANGTWIGAAEPWRGSDYTIVEVMTPHTGIPGGNMTASMNRYVRDINFRYSGQNHPFTGVKVFNQTGTSAAMPYPANADPALYQQPGIRIEGNSFYTMDTAIDLEDCGECVLEKNQIRFVKTGIVDGGNNFSVVVDNNALLDGSNHFTNSRSGATIGIFSASETRWICNGGTGPSCQGGRPEQTKIVSPQGLTVSNTIVSTFDMDADLVNIQGGNFHDDGFDYGGAGPQSSVANPTIYLGRLNWFQMHHCLVANNQAHANPIEIASPVSSSTDAANLDGLWITDNFIQSYQNSSTASGIYFQPGDHARRNVYIVNNQFSKLRYGVTARSPVTFSVVRGNYGFSLSGALLDFDRPAPGSFQSTIAADNTTPDTIPVLRAPSATGLVTEYNQSVSQLTGGQVGSGKGCTFKAGAAGDFCTAVVSLPRAYADTSYVVACSVQGGSGRNAIGSAVPITGQTIRVNEVALSGTDSGGGTIVCTANHD